MAQDSGLWKRGVILFAFIALIALVVLLIIFRKPPSAETKIALKPTTVVASLPSPPSPSLATVPWASYFQLAEHFPSPKGWKIRYAANMALAKRGSKEMRLDLMREMLDEEQQRINFRVKLKSGRYNINEGAVLEILSNTMKAFVEWHKKNKEEKHFNPENAELQKVYRAIDQLAQHPNTALREQAEKAREELGRT